ncbi:MAG: thioredoxin family protein, partial [Pseudomonadota bacterium]
AASARRDALFYTIGVIISFLAVAAVLIGLRAGGAEVGWGFQLQSAPVVMAIALILFIVSLNLLGFFEVSSRFTGVGQSLAQGTSPRASFFTGVLAVVVASPCTVPFMAPAVGVALSQSWFSAAAIFFLMGLGLAFPYLLVAYVPAFRERLPKPGPWMVRVRELLAFPMLATVLWLLWVLGIESNLEDVILALSAMLLISLAVWALRASRGGTGRAKAATAVLIAGCAVFAGFAERHVAFHQNEQSVETADLGSSSFSRAELASLRAEGQPVFLYFTAAWCITCKVNEQVALYTEQVKSLFEDHNITVLRGDWTNRDSEIAGTLAEFGRAGVPLYVLYNAEGEAQVLPQLLTPDVIRSAVEKHVSAG